MERKLHQEPQFDLETLRVKCDAWKSHEAAKVVIEWSTGTGPTVFYYPAGQRGQGVKWTVAVETYNYNEVYADFIEHKLIPQNSRGDSCARPCGDRSLRRFTATPNPAPAPAAD